MESSLKDLRFFFSRHTADEPALDLYETDEELVCEVDLPGVQPGDIQVQVDDNLLIIEGCRADADMDAGGYRYLCLERRLDSFKRNVKIPVMVDTLKGKAVYRHGVVRIVFPKVKERIIRIRIDTEER